MMRYTPDMVSEIVLNDLIRRGLNFEQITSIVGLSGDEFTKMIGSMHSDAEYFPAAVAGKLAKVFGYNKLFLIDGQKDLFYNFMDEDDVYRMWKTNLDYITRDYLFRLVRCWNHPKANEIYSLYTDIATHDSKIETLLKTRRIEDLFEELMEELYEREAQEAQEALSD